MCSSSGHEPLEADMNASTARYPRTVMCDGTSVEIRTTTPEHGPEIAGFVRTLSDHDLLFLRRDIGQPNVVEAWMSEIRQGRVQSLTAYADGRLVGYTAIIVERLFWSRYVGELRVLVGPSTRGKGLGRVLIQGVSHRRSNSGWRSCARR
jgi:GNAT superfamily N-acetyltransferase